MPQDNQRRSPTRRLQDTRLIRHDAQRHAPEAAAPDRPPRRRLSRQALQEAGQGVLHAQGGNAVDHGEAGRRGHGPLQCPLPPGGLLPLAALAHVNRRQIPVPGSAAIRSQLEEAQCLKVMHYPLTVYSLCALIG